MTSLYLNTSELRDKLLEMAKALFSKYPQIYYGKKWDHDEIWFSNYAENEPIDPKKEPDMPMIHWFEFTTTWLFDAVMEASNNRYTLEHRHLMFSGIQAILKGGENEDQFHPVDYLYEQFKKITWS